MRISSTVLGTGVAAFIVVAVALLMIFGLWNDEQSKVPAKFTTGQFAGLNNPSDIRGSYTFEDIEHYFSVPAETIAQAFAFDTSQKGRTSIKQKILKNCIRTLIMGKSVRTVSNGLFLFMIKYLTNRKPQHYCLNLRSGSWQIWGASMKRRQLY